MTKKEISTGVVHSVPKDLRKVLISSAAAMAAWEDITPLARNEKQDTRSHRIERTQIELIDGMRRPCCWPGCDHR